MSAQPSNAALTLHAFLLADAIYRDAETGKFVVAGTFHQLNVAAVPATFGRTIGVFASLGGLIGTRVIQLAFLSNPAGDVLLQTQFEVSSADGLPVDFALEVPPLPLPYAGRYRFLLLTDGLLLGEIPLVVQIPA